MNNIMKQNWIELLLVVSLSACLYPVIPIYSAIGLAILATLIYKKWEPKVVYSDVENMLIEADGVIAEQEEVIREYERIFQTLETSLPCNCGGNTFEGLFAPGVDTFVSCEKCGADYKVLVSFDSILMTDPMDLDSATQDMNNKIDKL